MAIDPERMRAAVEAAGILVSDESVHEEELVMVGKHVVHLVAPGGRMVYCGYWIEDEELDERAAWAHMPVCERCTKGRAAHERRQAEDALKARGVEGRASWL